MNIKDLYEQNYIGKEVIINGWIKSHRKQKDINFIDFYDGTSFKSVQVVYEETIDNFEEIQKLLMGSSIEVNGLVVESNKEQEFEIKANKINILGLCDEDYPLQAKGRPTREFLRDIAYLRPRTNLFQAVFKIRSVASFAIHSYFQENDFVYVHTPIITTADCEGSDQMFKLTTLDLNELPLKDGKVDFTKDLFGKKSFVTGSGQLHGEAFALAFKNIYTFLDEFVENGLIEKLNKLLDSKFNRITHHEAIDILKSSNQKWEFEPNYESDIAKEHEKYITEYFNGPVFITDWPKDIKAWYMKLNSDEKTVAAVDLEVPGAGELMGGSQREEDYDKILSRAKSMGVDLKTIDWFMNLRRFGGCVHSGFGMGFERLIIYLTGVENIRDVIPFPRTPNSCEF